MSEGLTAIYTADYIQRYREAVQYPAAERRAAIDRELALMRRASGGTGLGLARWLTQPLQRLAARGQAASPAPAPGA